eukprot:CAMPEP_0168229358 /NCGR_PEP_ID=MMETSP0140_2-20121125/15231_1 /TAXON_ID=44445 /ORGANISM="Pseudo-nitzschia australis, Strain 10249 10 AB" /LENGTH=490 /DNA_ID=CAMNT_0008161161 /DNA_START=44 /DNA_END=1516 /DNA_ORIENTATION=-
MLLVRATWIATMMMATSNKTLTAAFTEAGSSSLSGNSSSFNPSTIQQLSIEFCECESPTTNTSTSSGSTCTSTSTTTTTANDSDSSSNCTKIREALRGDFPEIDVLCSDAYLESVASVPGRSLDYVIHHKVRGSLEWRRSYGVDALRSALVHVPGEATSTNAADGDSKSSCNNNSNNNSSNPVGATFPSGGGFVPSADGDEQMNINDDDDDDNDNGDSSMSPKSENETIRESSPFVPTPELVEVCVSGAFVVRDEELMEEDADASSSGTNNNNNNKNDDDDDDDDDDGSHPSRYHYRRRLVVYADTSRLNWWQTGVKAGLQYHVLVLEQALERIRTENSKQNSNSTTTYDDDNDDDTTEGRAPPPPLSESIVVFVDTTNLPRLPPPLSVPRGMLELVKKAYPGRIHRIYVGPVHPWLRKLYNYLAASLQPKTREKIVLLDEAPSFAKLGSSRDVVADCNRAHPTHARAYRWKNGWVGSSLASTAHTRDRM